MILLTLSVSILGAWALCAAVLMGIGGTILRWLGLPLHPACAFWLGLAGAVPALETYHLLRPIDSVAVALLVAWGVWGLATNRPLLGQLIGDSRALHPAFQFALAATLIILSVRASGPCEHYDTGLYGAATVRWFTTYPAVPGLANLHGRLGFNSSLLSLVAVLNQGLATPLAFRITAGLLVLVAACLVLTSVSRLLGDSNSSFDWYRAVLIVPLTFWIFHGDLVGTNTDIPASILSLFALQHLFRAFHPAPTTGDPVSPRSDLLVSLALLSLGVTFKLSTATLAVGASTIAFLKLASADFAPQEKRRTLKMAFLIPLISLLPWIGHGFILSGYPAYPSSALGLPVDWRLPVQSVQLVRAGVQAWARQPHTSLQAASGTLWLGPWFQHARADREGFLFPLSLAAFGAVSIIAAGWRRKANRSIATFLPLLAIICGMVSWFYLAPALRFAEGLFWSFPAVLAGLGVPALLDRIQVSSRAPLHILLAGGAVLALLSVYPRTLWKTSFRPAFATRQYSPFPPADVIPVRNPNGVTILIPRSGNQCWDAPLPCSAYLNPTLRLRGAGGLRTGFVSDNLPPNAEWVSSRTQ